MWQILRVVCRALGESSKGDFNEKCDAPRLVGNADLASSWVPMPRVAVPSAETRLCAISRHRGFSQKLELWEQVVCNVDDAPALLAHRHSAVRSGNKIVSNCKTDLEHVEEGGRHSARSIFKG
jgi:hypothetical protein